MKMHNVVARKNPNIVTGNVGHTHRSMAALEMRLHCKSATFKDRRVPRGGATNEGRDDLVDYFEEIYGD